MTYHEAENYLFSLANLPRQEYMKDPRAAGVYLERTKYFLKLLGNPEKKIPRYIHITGTSGKGSVTTFLHAILTAAGKKTGRLISPHASELTERWHVGHSDMSKKEFTGMVSTVIKPLLDRYIVESPYDMPSFHEITDIMGFYYFAQKKSGVGRA